MFSIHEDDLQLAASHGFRDVIGVKARKATPPDGGRTSRPDRIYSHSRTEMYNARHPGACSRSETPRIDAEIRKRYDFMRSEVCWFGNLRMARQIAG